MHRARNALLALWLATITVFVAWRELAPAEAAPAPPRTASFDVIDVHRINIVEPDGKPRVILTNSQRFPGAYFDGKEYPHPNRDATGGLLFFNTDGTEAGGISYFNDAQGAGAMFTMDQLNQNEALRLVYQTAHGKHSAGLMVAGDHPNKSLKPLIETDAALRAAKTDAEKQRLKAKLDQLAKEAIGEISQRVFVGKEGDDAELILADKQNRPRLKLLVDGAGNPSIELFDANGKTIKKL